MKLKLSVLAGGIVGLAAIFGLSHFVTSDRSPEKSEANTHVAPVLSDRGDASFKVEVRPTSPEKSHTQRPRSADVAWDQFILPAIDLQQVSLKEGAEEIIALYQRVSLDTDQTPVDLTVQVSGISPTPSIDLKLQKVRLGKALELLAAGYGMEVELTEPELVFRRISGSAVARSAGTSSSLAPGPNGAAGSPSSASASEQVRVSAATLASIDAMYNGTVAPETVLNLPANSLRHILGGGAYAEVSEGATDAVRERSEELAEPEVSSRIMMSQFSVPEGEAGPTAGTIPRDQFRTEFEQLSKQPGTEWQMLDPGQPVSESAYAGQMEITETRFDQYGYLKRNQRTEQVSFRADIQLEGEGAAVQLEQGADSAEQFYLPADHLQVIELTPKDGFRRYSVVQVLPKNGT